MKRYRPNVAALILNSKGRLLVCERLKIPGAWQFPQGGVDEGEDLQEALIREVEEEVGLPRESYEIVKQRGGYQYDYPDSVQLSFRKAQFAGQEQTYFLCQLPEEEPSINLDCDSPEFSASRWIEPHDFQLSWLPDFKKQTYCEVMRDFFEVELVES